MWFTKLANILNYYVEHCYEDVYMYVRDLPKEPRLEIFIYNMLLVLVLVCLLYN